MSYTEALNIPHYGGQGVKKGLNVLREQLSPKSLKNPNFTEPTELSNETSQADNNQTKNQPKQNSFLNRMSNKRKNLKRKAGKKVVKKVVMQLGKQLVIWIGWFIVSTAWIWIPALLIGGIILSATSDKGLATKLGFEWVKDEVGGKANTTISWQPGMDYVGGGTTTGGTTTGSDEGYVNINSYPDSDSDDDAQLSSVGVMNILGSTYSVKNGKEEWVNGLRKSTAEGLIKLSDACKDKYGADGGCTGWIITSGTDSNHAEGVYSHAEGYKVDLRSTNAGPSGTNPSVFITDSDWPFTQERQTSDWYDIYTAEIDGYKITILDERTNPKGGHWDVKVVTI